MNASRLAIVVGALAGAVCAACAVGTHDTDDGGPAVAADASSSSAKDAQSNASDAHSAKDASVATQDATGATDAAAAPDVFDAGPPPEPIVYGHTPDTLYTFDPETNALAEVAKFSGCSQSTNATEVLDLAIDANMNAFATTVDGLYTVDLTTAECTLVEAGSYPNSLSFVPAGTLDPNVEALVGYFGSEYVRIDTSSGNMTDIGSLTGGYASSGDIVSIAGGGSFLTVTGNGCGDCLFQVDPSTGDMIQNYGALPYAAVYGLGYWAGALYGFDGEGDLFAIGGGDDGGLATQAIVDGDGGVVWWGAGSTTRAPVSAPDGGTFPTQ